MADVERVGDGGRGQVSESTRPVRIQRLRAKGWRMPPNTVYIGRPSRWGNPATVELVRSLGYRHPGGALLTDREAAAVAVSLFRDQLVDLLKNGERAAYHFGDPPRVIDYDKWPWTIADLAPLRGHNLACWCPLTLHGKYWPCHADVLLELANR